MNFTNNCNLTSNVIRLLHDPYSPGRFPCSTESDLLPSLLLNCSFPGSQAEQIALVMRAAGLRFELIPMNDTLREEMGFMRAAYHLIDSCVVHSAAMTYAITTQRTQLFQLSYFFPRDEGLAALVVPTPNSESVFFGHLSVFELEAWVAILVLMFLVRLIQYYGHKIELAMLLDYENHSAKLAAFKQSLTFAVVWVTFFIFLLGSLFGNSVVSMLVMKQSRAQFKSLEELTPLIERKSIKVITNRGASWLTTIQDLSERNLVYGNLNRALQRNPIVPHEDLLQTCALLQQRGHVLIEPTTIALYTQQQCCNIELINLIDFTYSHGGVIMFSHHVSNQLIRRLNRAIIETHAGLNTIGNRYRTYLTRHSAKPICKTHFEIGGTKNFLQQERINSDNTGGLFLLWFIGCIVGLVLCWCEVVWQLAKSMSRWKKK